MSCSPTLRLHRLGQPATPQHSGTKGLEHRAGLFDAIGYLPDAPGHRSRAEGIVVYRLDRLSRDLVLQETLLADIWRVGARLHSTAAGEAAFIDPDEADPSRALIRQILGAVAQYERAMVRLRLEAGKARKAAAGGYVGGGVPLGMTVRGKALEPDEGEQRALRRITELRGDGATLRQIAATLAAEGHETKRGGRWQPETVRKVLARIA